MRSKLPAQRSSRAISILRRSSPVVTRPKFLSHPNPSSKRCPREKNHPPQTGRLARNPARTASVDAAADAVVDAAVAVAVENKRSLRPSLQLLRKASFPKLESTRLAPTR